MDSGFGKKFFLKFDTLKTSEFKSKRNDFGFGKYCNKQDLGTKVSDGETRKLHNLPSSILSRSFFFFSVH